MNSDVIQLTLQNPLFGIENLCFVRIQNVFSVKLSYRENRSQQPFRLLNRLTKPKAFLLISDLKLIGYLGLFRSLSGAALYKAGLSL